jgi:hypothetical protein
MPFLLASALLTRARRLARWMPYLGCGCGSGPSARSVPAAIVAAALFGVPVAVARLVAAHVAGRVFRRAACAHGDSITLLDDLRGLLPAAVISGTAAQLLPRFDLGSLGAPASIAAGALLGFAVAPCGLGGVAVAATIRQHSPIAAAAFLAVAGIADARTFSKLPPSHESGRDAFAYALAALSCAIVAIRHGDALVHPFVAVALAGSAVACAALFVSSLRTYRAELRVAPAVMLAGALASAPPPPYRVSETTMRELFNGERLGFTGRLVRDASGDALVRYAIFCCRADAAPIVIRLSEREPHAPGTWLHADGEVAERAGRFELRTKNVETVAPPADPFVYR